MDRSTEAPDYMCIGSQCDCDQAHECDIYCHGEDGSYEVFSKRHDHRVQVLLG